MRFRIVRATNVVLGLLCLMYLLTYVDRLNFSTVVLDRQFLKEIPLDKVQIGFVFSAFAYPYLIFQVIGGWVADRFGPRRALTVFSVSSLPSGRLPVSCNRRPTRVDLP